MSKEISWRRSQQNFLTCGLPAKRTRPAWLGRLHAEIVFSDDEDPTANECGRGKSAMARRRVEFTSSIEGRSRIAPRLECVVQFRETPSSGPIGFRAEFACKIFFAAPY